MKKLYIRASLANINWMDCLFSKRLFNLKNLAKTDALLYIFTSLYQEFTF